MEEMVRPLYDSNKVIAVVNKLVNAGNNFALFRHPNEESITLYVETEGKVDTSFYISSFDTDKQKKAEIKADILLKDAAISLENLSFLSTEKEKTQELPTEMGQHAFENYVQHIINRCKTDEVEKVVAARVKLIDKNEKFDAGVFITNLLNNYPTAFVSIWQHSEFGLWAGATPEILIKQKDNTYETMSLAGTKRIDINREWTAKEREEQQIVTDTILHNLNNISIDDIKCTEAKAHQAGHIAHLKSTISFSTDKKIQAIAKALHPTPAVGGLPLYKALSIIKENEKENRAAYAGYIGTADALYVNLRCMQIFKSKIALYIGAGITKDSKPNEEWMETENKSQTLLKFIVK